MKYKTFYLENYNIILIITRIAYSEYDSDINKLAFELFHKGKNRDEKGEGRVLEVTILLSSEVRSRS